MFDLRAFRRDSGLTLVALAAEIGVSRHTLMRVEAGSIPQAPTAKKIADWVGKPPSELWPIHERKAAA